MPVIKYYEELGKLKVVDAEGEVEEVYEGVRAAVGGLLVSR